MEVEDLATANLSWDLSKGPVPHQLQGKAVDHCLLEVLGYNNGANHATLRLVFERPQIQASPYAPANTQGVRMELEVQDDTGPGPVEGQLVVTTFTFTGAHRKARVSHGLLVKSGRTVGDFINVAKKVNLTPCDFNSVGSEAAGCRDFISQFIYHLDRHDVLLLPNDKAASVYDIFNWRYSAGGAARIPKAIHYAAFNHNYQHIDIAGCVYDTST
ncbi:hypothetical protein N7489_000248 [Penicillium chrysogenum]|uniref:Uncharacterized protein n=1 Tax=Penicillium chrysogenum TaxID=5076 RepID=A0ABQ8WFE2_PENCH|nr:uncharacterized protein N7489_000248 [Penicillium chrysogenum]KAJ5249838.1 hypothetical protein N7489_000248 [Penicillium chrysogenum]KAJ5268744.1 hypothetical protein N7505_004502 [Penicillium chrysogenum]KAJ6148547.1 hypothetical protein N7497_010529 [Penicillium chrysogenum]